MLLVALRPLLALFAVLGALTASDADSSCVGVARRYVAPAASLQDGSGSDQDPGRPGFAMLGEPAPSSPAGTEEPGRDPRSSSERRACLPQAERTESALDPRRCGALASGERPAALAFLRTNGSANAGGAGT